MEAKAKPLPDLRPGSGEEEEGWSPARKAAVAAVVVAVLVAAYIFLFSGGDDYKVTAKFQSASQLVEGNQVEVAGAPAGTIEKIRLGDDGQAEVEMKISEKFVPLRRGSKATIRSVSQSGVANRYVQIDLPSEDKAGEKIPDGGTLEQTETVSEVDLDQLFNTLDDETIKNLKLTLKGLANQYRGVGPEANQGFKYLNPFLYTSRRLFGELNRDQPALESLILDTSKLSGALAERSDDLSGLITNLNHMMGAIGRQEGNLAASVGKLPPFMRTANTTFVNLRATLDDVDPLVNASKPVAKKLQPFFRDLRGFTRGAEPTVKRLRRIIRRRGTDNDLVDLTRLAPRQTQIALGPVNRNGAQREGAFPASVRAMRDSQDTLAQFRPYTTELTGWIDDFSSHSGGHDANGGYGRIATNFNAFSASLNGGIPVLGPALPPAARATNFLQVADIGNLRKCPGANERDPGDGSTPFTDGGKLNCDPSQVPLGP
jgi:phospholipid/cholesterol/gamma-HCH transport system substrate-binding protein